MTNPYQPSYSPDPWSRAQNSTPDNGDASHQPWDPQPPTYQQPPSHTTHIRAEAAGQDPGYPSQPWPQVNSTGPNACGYQPRTNPQNLPHTQPPVADPMSTYPPTQPYAQPTSSAVAPTHNSYWSPGTPAQFTPVQRKEPWLSLLVSFFIPGVGSMINGDTRRGVGILVGYLACAALSWLLLPIAGMIAFFVWGLVDAYQGAERWNRMHGL